MRLDEMEVPPRGLDSPTKSPPNRMWLLGSGLVELEV